jgi:hypothetical protein
MDAQGEILGIQHPVSTKERTRQAPHVPALFGPAITAPGTQNPHL